MCVILEKVFPAFDINLTTFSHFQRHDRISERSTALDSEKRVSVPATFSAFHLISLHYQDG